MTGNAAQDLTLPSLDDQAISEQAWAQLERICTHPLFSETTRMKRFLTYIVTETLEGKADRLKGYSLGIEVFDRPDSFDAQADTIVRVQAGQLRRRLDLFYSDAGKDDPVRILIPKGSYVPRFEIRQSGDSAPEKISHHDMHTAQIRALDPAIGPGVMITNFDNLGDPMDYPFTHGMSTEIANALTHFRYLRIVSRTASAVTELVSRSFKDLSEEFDTDYVVSGSVRRSGDVVRVTVTLIEMRSGKHLYSHNYDRQYTIENLLHIQEDIASQVASEIGSPYGVINRLIYQRTSDKVNIDAYEALLRYYAFMGMPTVARAAEVIADLEKVIADYPRYSSAWAALALVQSFRVSQEPTTDDPDIVIEQALRAARRATAIDGRNALAYQALLTAHFHAGEIDAYRLAAAQAITLNPNDDNLIGFYGVTLALIGESDMALAFCNKALKLNTNPPGWYNVPIALKLLREGDYEGLLAQIGRHAQSDFLWSQGLAITAYGHLGDQEAAAPLIKAMCKGRPDPWAALAYNFKVWNFDSILQEAVWSGFLKAGLKEA